MPQALDERWDADRLSSAYEHDDAVDLMPHIRALMRRWPRIALATLAAMLLTGALTGFVMPKWYRAQAVIRPIAQPAIQGRVAGMLGSIGGGLASMGAASLLGAGGSDAEEYIAILKGFDFNVTLAKRHNLEAELLKPGLLSFLHFGPPGDTQWRVYRALEKRFDVTYSIRTGNITLSYQDKDRVKAQQILSYYVDDLRDLLRQRTIRDANAAIKSMIAEANATPDTLLQTRLYELVARQMQQRKLAEVEADFAFRVLDSPAASDKPFSPQVLLDCILAALLTFILYSLAIIVYECWVRAFNRYPTIGDRA